MARLPSLAQQAVRLVDLELVFSQVVDQAGWTVLELLVVMGVYIFKGGVIHAYIQPNMLRLDETLLRATITIRKTPINKKPTTP